MVDVKYKMTPLGELPLDWNTKSIEEVCEILDSKRVPLNKQQREAMQGDIPYYGANGVLDFINDYLFDEPLILMAEDGGYFSEYNTRPIAYKVSGKSWVNNHAHILKPIENEVFDWIYYNLVHKNILPFINGGTRAKLNQKDLRRLPIAYPPIKEQQKIAAILSSVDEAIEKTEQIIEQTETVKKGLMQQLLTKGIGHTEFKHSPFGEIPNNWEILTVNEFAVVDYGISEAVSNNTDPTIGIPIITGANITLDGKLDMSKKVYIRKREHERFQLNKGDLLFNWRSGSQHHVGKTAIFNLDEEYTFASFILKIRVNDECDNKFYYHLLNYLKSIQYFSKDTSVQVNFKLNASSFRELLLLKPPLEEQREISSRINSIQNKIEFERQKVIKLSEIKNGLMQQLLTGKTRVKVDDDEEVPS